MVNNVYITPRGNHALGGLVNGVIDDMIIVTTGEATVFEIHCDDNSTISLSTKYSMIIDHKPLPPPPLPPPTTWLQKFLYRAILKIYKLIPRKPKPPEIYPEPETIPANYIEPGIRLFRADGSSTKVLSVKQRRGKEVIIPKRLININDFLVVFHGG